MANEHHNHPHPGSISVQEAIDATTNWRTYLSSSNGEFQLRSFWGSIDKIKSVLEKNPNADGLRFYLGLKDASDPTSVKIVLVPTENEQDVLELGDGRANTVDGFGPCPPVCVGGGSLNG
jgi:hypothetical protein